MKISKYQYVDASQKKNAIKKLLLDFGLFWPFLTKKQPKLTKNEENWQNSNRLLNFFEIWYVDASQQNKMLQKNFFLDFGLFWPFFNQKQPKKNEKKMAKSKPFDDIF